MPDNQALARKNLSYLATPVSERTLDDYVPFFETLAPDVELVFASPAGKGALNGKDEVVAYITDLFTNLSSDDQNDDVELETPLEFFGENDRIIVTWTECKRNKDSGLKHGFSEVVVVFGFHDGLVTRMLRLSD